MGAINMSMTLPTDKLVSIIEYYVMLSGDKPSTRLSKLSKEIEMIGIDIKDLNEQTETGLLELKTKFINQNFSLKNKSVFLQKVEGNGFGLDNRRDKRLEH